MLRMYVPDEVHLEMKMKVEALVPGVVEHHSNPRPWGNNAPHQSIIPRSSPRAAMPPTPTLKKHAATLSQGDQAVNPR